MLPNGSIQFFNPGLPSEYEIMTGNPIQMNSNSIRVGLGTTVTSSDLVDGNLITQENTNASGRFVGYGGSVTGNLTLTNVGAGFTPSDAAYYTFTGIALTAITGSGINAVADITISNGVAIGATITDGGKGFAIGDVLQPISIGNKNLGSGMRLSVSNIYGRNELVH